MIIWQTGLYSADLNKDRSAHNTRPQANQLKTETRPFCTSTPAEKCTSQEQTTHQCINVPTHSRPAPSCEESDRENYSTTKPRKLFFAPSLKSMSANCSSNTNARAQHTAKSMDAANMESWASPENSWSLFLAQPCSVEENEQQ